MQKGKGEFFFFKIKNKTQNDEMTGWFLSTKCLRGIQAAIKQVRRDHFP